MHEHRVDVVLRRAAERLREGLDAHRQGRKFRGTWSYDGAWVSIDTPWVRVQLNHESRGLDIEEAAARAGVGAPSVRVPRQRPPAVVVPRVEPAGGRLDVGWLPGEGR